MKIYTKTGDGGQTSLVGGVRISKTSTRIEAYGTVDELNSHLGLLAALMDDGPEREAVYRIQHDLFMVGTCLATDTAQTALPDSARLDAGETGWLEQQIDAMTAAIPPARSFILPGGCRAAAQAHVCRSVCRRAERRIVALGAETPVPAEIMKYVNRLSDYLFILAKKINFINNCVEKTWPNSCR